MLDPVVVLGVHAHHADAAALLLPVGRSRDALDVAGLRDRDDHVLFADQLLEVELALRRHDLGAPVVAEATAELAQLVLDDPVDAGLVGEDRAQLGDESHQLAVLPAHLVLLERCQRAQAQVEDRAGLQLRQAELAHQRLARRIAVGRAADHGDHAVEVVERDQVALEDVETILRPLQPELGAPGDDFLLVVHVVAKQRLQAERAGSPAHEGHDVGAERGLQRRVLVELVEHDLGHLAALQLDPDAHAVAVRLVGDVADAGDDLLVHELGDLREHAVVAALAHLVGQLRDDDRVVAALLRLDVRDGAHADAAAAVSYASRIPARPMITPPVGKSGPLTCSISSSVVIIAGRRSARWRRR